MVRVQRISVIGAIALALAVPAAAGAQQDLRSPDARAAAVDHPSEQSAPAAAATATPTDLRSPDVQDAASQAGIDLRSPDVQDAAASRPAPAAAATAASTPVVGQASTGFEWGDAGIGAAGMLALVLLVVGAGMVAVRHRHGHAVTPTQ
jgi:hypothetical protein